MLGSIREIPHSYSRPMCILFSMPSSSKSVLNKMRQTLFSNVFPLNALTIETHKIRSKRTHAGPKITGIVIPLRCGTTFGGKYFREIYSKTEKYCVVRSPHDIQCGLMITNAVVDGLRVRPCSFLSRPRIRPTLRSAPFSH